MWWHGRYVFKRLKFLGSKELSQLITLFFLALWHGLYSGYFMNFAFEFFIVLFEKQVGRRLAETNKINSKTRKGITKVTYMLYCFGISCLPVLIVRLSRTCYSESTPYALVNSSVLTRL